MFELPMSKTEDGLNLLVTIQEWAQPDALPKPYYSAVGLTDDALARLQADERYASEIRRQMRAAIEDAVWKDYATSGASE